MIMQLPIIEQMLGSHGMLWRIKEQFNITSGASVITADSLLGASACLFWPLP